MARRRTSGKPDPRLLDTRNRLVLPELGPAALGVEVGCFRIQKEPPRET